jgi:pimeloyl-ACP methyl ester carboxylesterase
VKLALFALALFVLVSAALAGCASLRAEKNAPPIGEFVEVGGERIHLVDYGPRESDTPAIVLIHGASVNLRDMKIALGDALAGNYRVIAVDRPGRGYSTRPADGWRIDVQARLIREAVRARGATRTVVVGQSFGGAVALAYALQYQDEMSGLVLLAPVSHEWPGGVAWYNRVSGWPALGFIFRRLVVPAYAPLAAKQGVENSFGAGDAPEDYYERSGLPLLFRPSDFKHNAADLRRLKEQIVSQSRRYGEIGVATAIFAGDADRTVSTDIHARRLATEMPGARLTIIPGAGHALHHSHAAPIIAAIEEFAGEPAR